MNSFSSSHPCRGDTILWQLLRTWERLGERSRSGNSGVCAAADTATAVLPKRIAEVWAQGHRHGGPGRRLYPNPGIVPLRLFVVEIVHNM